MAEVQSIHVAAYIEALQAEHAALTNGQATPRRHPHDLRFARHRPGRGITDYLTNGGRIEVAQRMAGHPNAKTTGLYDRFNDDVSGCEVEKTEI